MKDIKFFNCEKMDTPHTLSEGDLIYYYSLLKKKNIYAEFIGPLNEQNTDIIVCMSVEDNIADILDCNETEIFKVSLKSQLSSNCECGAAHTSNPNFHLGYCSMA